MNITRGDRIRDPRPPQESFRTAGHVRIIITTLLACWPPSRPSGLLLARESLRLSRAEFAVTQNNPDSNNISFTYRRKQQPSPSAPHDRRERVKKKKKKALVWRGGGKRGKGYNSSLFPVPAASALQRISGLSCPPPPTPHNHHHQLPPLPQPPRAAVLWIKQWHVYTAVFSPPRSGTGGKSIARDRGSGFTALMACHAPFPSSTLDQRLTPTPSAPNFRLETTPSQGEDNPVNGDNLVN